MSSGLVLLTGGRSRRFGRPKHLEPHWEGGTWGSHLVRVFETVFSGGPVRILGHPLGDLPELGSLPDRRTRMGDGLGWDALDERESDSLNRPHSPSLEGPARALAAWAVKELERPERWWLVACDQPYWNPEALANWWARARKADPDGEGWVLARVEGREQPFGSFLGGKTLVQLAALAGASMRDLQRQVPTFVLDAEGSTWNDIDEFIKQG